MNFKKMTWAQMAETVDAIHTEMKRRNPIGINLYAPMVKHAAFLLREIAGGEAGNFTSECGPKEPSKTKPKYELCDTVFPSGEKCVRPKNHHGWSKTKCSPTVKFMEYSAVSQSEKAKVRVLENKAIRKEPKEPQKVKKRVYRTHWRFSVEAFCGAPLSVETTRDKLRVTCLTCRKLMKLHGHLEEQ